MGNSFNWRARKNRKCPRALHTFGEERDNELKARQLARRIKLGRKSRQARRHGAVHHWSAEEVAAWAKRHGYPVAGGSPDPATPPR